MFQLKAIELKGIQLPVRLILERRSAFRASLGKQTFILRMPKGLNRKQQQEGVSWFRNWAESLIEAEPAIIPFLGGKDYHHTFELPTRLKKYQVHWWQEDRKTGSARLSGVQLQLKLPETLYGFERNLYIKRLLSRAVAGDQAAAWEARVQAINARTFQQFIKGVQLKYNVSNWGSCSNHQRINLSTRLLLAPSEVQDYVILHELAHLIEFNHSRRFWALISRFDPDYSKKENWLRTHRYTCDF